MNDVIRNSAKKLTCINEVVTLDKPAMAGDDFHILEKTSRVPILN